MKRLAGKEILIGRDPSTHGIRVAVDNKSDVLKGTLAVPNSVSRCMPAENKSHCVIKVADDGSLKLCNSKFENKTYADGQEVVSKVIKSGTRIELGADRYVLPLGNVLELALKLAVGKSEFEDSGDQKDSVSIKHLEKVYDEYNQRRKKILEDQDKINRRRMVPMMLGMFSTVVGGILAALKVEIGMYISIPVALLSFGLYLKMYFTKNNTQDRLEELNNWLIDNYVCPAHGCGKHVGNKQYKLLVQQGNCVFCKKKWIG